MELREDEELNLTQERDIKAGLRPCTGFNEPENTNSDGLTLKAIYLQLLQIKAQIGGEVVTIADINRINAQLDTVNTAIDGLTVAVEGKQSQAQADAWNAEIRGLIDDLTATTASGLASVERDLNNQLGLIETVENKTDANAQAIQASQADITAINGRISDILARLGAFVTRDELDPINARLDSLASTLAGKQDALNTVQTYAVNSGITAEKVALYDTLKALIDGKQPAGSYATVTQLNNHLADNSNPHHVTKEQIGLGLADNTRDLDKPVSRATLSAIQAEAQTRADADASTLDNAKAYADQKISQAVASVYKVKGSVPTVAQLPGNADIGDVYNITSTGANYVKTADGWDKLSETVDLSDYAKKSEITQATAPISEAVLSLAGAVAVNSESISALETGKQSKLSPMQEEAVNSGITAATVRELQQAAGDIAIMQGQINGKQDRLTPAQLTAVNSGISADKIAIYDGYAAQIDDKVSLTEAQTIAGHKNFLNGIDTDGLTARGGIQAQEIGILGDAYVSGGFEADADSYFQSSLSIAENLDVGGTINGLNTADLMTLNTEQTATAKKHFDGGLTAGSVSINAGSVLIDSATGAFHNIEFRRNDNGAIVRTSNIRDSPTAGQNSLMVGACNPDGGFSWQTYYHNDGTHKWVELSGVPVGATYTNAVINKGWIWDTSASAENNLVHRTVDESVAGVKTFTASKTLVKNTAFSVTENRVAHPAATHTYLTYEFIDKDNKRIGLVESCIYNNGQRYHALAWNPYKCDGSGEIGWTYIGLRTSANNKAFGYTSYRPYSEAESSDILTKGHVASISELVHTTGDEDISGIKRFNTPLQVKSTAWTSRTQYLSAFRAMDINFLASDNSSVAKIRFQEEGVYRDLMVGIWKNSINEYEWTRIARMTK